MHGNIDVVTISKDGGVYLLCQRGGGCNPSVAQQRPCGQPLVGREDKS